MPVEAEVERTVAALFVVESPVDRDESRLTALLRPVEADVERAVAPLLVVERPVESEVTPL